MLARQHDIPWWAASARSTKHVSEKGALMHKIFLTACVVLGVCSDAAAQDQIEAGEQVYEEHCATCHGVKLRRTGAMPDLKDQKADGRARFDQMVMGGRGKTASGVAGRTFVPTDWISCGPT